MRLSEWFLAALKEYDDSLSAIYDDHEDSVHLFYQKSGQKSLAYSVKREFAEMYPELERRIIKQLPEHDIWKRFGSGDNFDDYLEHQARKARESAQRDMDNERWAMIKDHKREISHARENARSGILSGKGKQQEIPTITVPEIPKEGEGK